jgi:hypothetical protein
MRGRGAYIYSSDARVEIHSILRLLLSIFQHIPKVFFITVSLI